MMVKQGIRRNYSIVKNSMDCYLGNIVFVVIVVVIVFIIFVVVVVVAVFVVVVFVVVVFVFFCCLRTKSCP